MKLSDLLQFDNIIVQCHDNPDADALASGFGAVSYTHLDVYKRQEKEYCYFGATVGRYANRISDAKVNIDGVEYKLEANDNENSLHSGSNGFSKRFWTVKEQKADEITFEIEMCIRDSLTVRKELSKAGSITGVKS